MFKASMIRCLNNIATANKKRPLFGGRFFMDYVLFLGGDDRFVMGRTLRDSRLRGNDVFLMSKDPRLRKDTAQEKTIR